MEAKCDSGVIITCQDNNKKQKVDVDEKYLTSPIVEITNEKFEYKIEVPLHVFKNTGSIKWNAILKEYIDDCRTSLTKIDKVNHRMEYTINECFKEDIVLFVINYLKSSDNLYNAEFLKNNWKLIYKLGDYWSLKSIMQLVQKYLLGTLLDFDVCSRPVGDESFIKIQSQFLIDNGISTIGYEIYHGLLLEDRSASETFYNPICNSPFYPDNKVVRAGSINCNHLIKDLKVFIALYFINCTRFNLLIGFLNYIDSSQVQTGSLERYLGILTFVKYLQLSNH